MTPSWSNKIRLANEYVFVHVYSKQTTVSYRFKVVLHLEPPPVRTIGKQEGGRRRLRIRLAQCGNDDIVPAIAEKMPMYDSEYAEFPNAFPELRIAVQKADYPIIFGTRRVHFVAERRIKSWARLRQPAK
jgi:hypothetical protein